METSLYYLICVFGSKSMTSKAGTSGHHHHHHEATGGNSWERSYRHVRDNHRIHLEYTNRDFDSCLAHIEEALEQSEGLAEYPLYVKALIRYVSKTTYGSIVDARLIHSDSFSCCHFMIQKAAAGEDPRVFTAISEGHGVEPGQREQPETSGKVADAVGEV